jgi:asparagine synthase (glutamine-hydrolysing)
MYHDMRTYLPGDILTKVDRAAMSTGLETRIPILDHRVVEFAATLPTRYLRKNRDGKRVLREVLFRRCPKELFDRPKRGFAVPVREWLRTDLRDWAEAQLDPHRLEQEGYLRAAPIRRVWHEHLSGERNWQHQLWPVLMFQAWMEETGKSAATAPPARRSLHPTEPAT